MVVTLSGLLTFATYAFAAMLLIMASIAGTLLFTRLGSTKPASKPPVAPLAKSGPTETPAVAPLSPILSAIQNELQAGNVDAALVLIAHEAAKPKA